MTLIRYHILPVLLTMAAIAGCKHEITTPGQEYQVKLNFQNMVDSNILQLNTNYLNPHQEPFTVTNFRYYISNISFTDSVGNETNVANSYFLVDEKISSSKSFIVSVPHNRFVKLNFYVGVDSVRNVSGVQTGALDPANGMFWTWSTGYIMAKLEGTSPVSPAPLSAITYHIGGFKNDENVVKRVSLPLSLPLSITKEKPSEILLTANVNAWFKGTSNVKISENAYCMNPGTLSNAIAANYLRMFSVKQVIN